MFNECNLIILISVAVINITSLHDEQLFNLFKIIMVGNTWMTSLLSKSCNENLKLTYTDEDNL